MNMRLVTYNIRGGLGMDGVRSIGRIAEVLRPLDADVICVQEVHRRLPMSRFQDQFIRLSRGLGMPGVFQSNYRVGFGIFGNAILTRFPVRFSQDVKLPNPVERASILRRMEGRGLLVAELAIDGSPAMIMCTHWSLDSGDRFQAADVVGRLCVESGMPVVLAGDFNASADSAEVTYFRKTSSLLDSDANLEGLTFPSNSPAVRIDYVWRSPSIKASNFAVIETMASDHLPVCVDLVVPQH